MGYKIRSVNLETVCGITSKLPENRRCEAAFAGKSNVGKSSLINALMERKSYARISSQPGKTQTINYYRINEGENREDFAPDCYLVDLPGYGYANASVEVKAKWGKMIERYLHTSGMLKSVFLLVDIRHAPSANDRLMYSWVVESGRVPVIIATKKDKIKRSQLQGALKAIRAAQAKGNKVFLCTGRNPDMLKPLLRFGFDGYVGAAGGYVVVDDEVIYDQPMTKEDTELALELLHKNGVFCTVEGVDGSWGDENLGEFLAGQGEGNSEIERWRKALASNLHILPMSQYDGRPVFKVVIMCLKMEQLDEAKAALEDRYDFVVQDVPAHGCVNGELINRAFDKGRGIIRVCEKLGVPVANSYSFGDSMNDLAAIQAAGYSVCMENGSETLKKYCDMVCPSVDDDGIAKAFEQLGLV